MRTKTSEKQLKRLKEHSYKATGSTLLDPYMQIWWGWVVQKFPLWLAPNVITLSGLIVVIFTSVLHILYSPDARQPVPPWLTLLGLLSVFIYQTLDACDGKQARRTQSQSQLGELFDHGCDSLSTIFIALLVVINCRMGDDPSILFFQCCYAICLFYIAHWQTYVSGSLRFGKFDVTEIQISIMLMLLTTLIFGSSIWDTHIPILNVDLNFLPTIGSIIGGIVAIYDNMGIILTGGVGKNGSSVAGTSVLSPSVPIMLLITQAIMIWKKSPSGLYENHVCFYLLFIGLIATKITIRLIVCHMSRSEIAYFDSSMLGLLFLILNQYFDCYIDETYTLWLAFGWTIYDLGEYITSLCREVAAYLNIYTFSIARRRRNSHG